MRLLNISFVLILALFTACGQKPNALKEGVINRVVWAPEPNSKSLLSRRKVPDNPEHREGGSYGVDMYGILYSSHLEVQYVGSPHPKSEIIPLSKIVFLEFGDGGISVD